MDSQPRNEHALELALNRLAGSNIKAAVVWANELIAKIAAS